MGYLRVIISAPSPPKKTHPPVPTLVWPWRLVDCQTGMTRVQLSWKIYTLMSWMGTLGCESHIYTYIIYIYIYIYVYIYMYIYIHTCIYISWLVDATNMWCTLQTVVIAASRRIVIPHPFRSMSDSMFPFFGRTAFEKGASGVAKYINPRNTSEIVASKSLVHRRPTHQ